MKPLGWKPAGAGSTFKTGGGSAVKNSDNKSKSPALDSLDSGGQLFGGVFSKDSGEALSEQLNAVAYECKDEVTRKLLREAAEAASSESQNAWLMLRSSGPANLPATITGTIKRQMDQGNACVVFTPDDPKAQSFKLKSSDLQGVPEQGRVTIKKFGEGKQQRLEIDGRSADKVSSFIGAVEVRGKNMVAVSLDPLSPIRELPLPGARADLAGKTIVAHVAEPLSEKRFGLVEEILPDRDGWKTTFLDLAVRHGVEATFPPDVKKELERLKKLFDPNNIAGYEDFTDKPFFAVDNPYSKDFDQAMHLEPSKTKPGCTDVYYAIADVSYFFKLLGEQSPLVQRATRMQTTTYLPGLDAPVLHRLLSEDLISLGAGQKRPAFVIKFTVDAKGEVSGEPTFHDAVVKNRVNTNYPAVQKHYDGAEKVTDQTLAKGLELLKTVGGSLLDQAKARGMVTSPEGETWGTIDKDGNLKLERRGSLWVEEANAQISITANHLIGKYLIQNQAPAFHRVHPEPDPLRLEAAKKGVKSLGIEWPEGARPADVLAKLDKTHPKWRIARRTILRAQPKAVVSSEPGSHAGLKLAEYVQSTAPMRRERDRRNHELVRAVRDGRTIDPAEMIKVVEYSLKAQQRDSLINRGVRDRLSAQALSPFQGKALKAEVIGVTPHGIDVYLPDADTEIFIPTKKFGTPMQLDKGGMGLRSTDGKIAFGAGDTIDVVVRSADAKKGQIDAVPRFDAAQGVKSVAAKALTGKELSLSQVRGDGFTSPYVGQTVVTQGVVTALNGIGFYIQPAGAKNSDGGGGLLVRTQHAGVAPGDLVSVRGTVREVKKEDAIYDRTVVELANKPEVKILAAGQTIPEAVTLSEPPPNDRHQATEYWRKLLGQRVKIPPSIAISPSNRFNDLVVLPEGWQIDAAKRSPQGGVLLDEAVENMCKVSIKARDNVGGLPPTAVGDSCEALEGVVTYRSGDFQIELTKAAKISHAPRPEPQATKLFGDENHVTMASVNTLNLHQGEAARAKRLAERIVFDLGAPDIIALQEIQDNDGPAISPIVAADQTYQMLIDRIEAAGGPKYSWVDIPPVSGQDGGQPGGNIRTGYLYRADRVKKVEGSERRIGVGSAAFEGTRKSLVVKFDFNGHEIIAVNNHLSSRRGSSPWNADVDELIVGGAEKRVAQAAEIRSTIEELRAANPKADVLVVGDYNDFPTSDTLKTLSGDGMTNMSLLVPEADRFDYNYRGTLQTLTSVVGNKELSAAGRIELEYLHHNSLNPLDDSDHDHLVVRVKRPSN